MKIWHLVSNRWNSAVTEYALSAARALDEQGHETLFTPLAGSPADRRANALGLRVRALNDFSLLKLGVIREIYRNFRPQIIFVHGGPESVLVRHLGVPTIRVRGVEFGKQGAFVSLRQQLAHARIAALVVPNQVLADEARRLLPSLPVHRVVLGCDSDRFHYITHARKSPMNALIFGRFDPVKGHAGFLRIWRLVKEQLPGALLHIVGEPANVSCAQLEEQVRAAGLECDRDVRITATRVVDVATLLSSASLGIVPSLGSEIIGRVTQEFLLCGTPVLVSGVGGLEELIFHSTAGASWRGLSEIEIATLVMKWLQIGSAESEADRAARAQQAKELFSIAAMGNELESVINSVKID